MVYDCKRTVAMSCSKSRETKTDVFRCPRNELEWKDRAKQLNCASFNQTCVEKTMFKYHCLLNAEGTALLEVCAPFKSIHGHKCAEYNNGGSIVQESHIDCNDSIVPCPYVYLSTELFKYQSCFDYVKIRSVDVILTTDNPSSKSGSEKCINKNWDKEIISLSVIAVLTIVVHVCLIVFKQKPCKKENQPGCHEYTSTLQNVDDGSWQTQSPI